LYAHWSPESYTVAFDSQGGSASDLTTIDVTYDDTYGDLATTSRTGYIFEGWYTEATGGDKITDITTVAITANTTLYAHWTPERYTVAFTAGTVGTLTGQTSFPDIIYNAAWDDAATVPVPVADAGYHFVGWTPLFPSAVTADLAFSAIFTQDTNITINYTASTGGSVDPLFESLPPATGEASGSTAAANSGYRFVNWTDESDTEVSTDATFIPEKSGGLNVNATYTANFEPRDDLTVTFVAGEHGSLTGTDYFEGIAYNTAWDSAVTVPTPVADTGYRFANWTPLFPATVTDDLAFTATFEPIDDLTVTFTAGEHGTLNGTTSYTNIDYNTAWGDAVTVPIPTADASYYFVNWTPLFPVIVTESLSFTAHFVEADDVTINYEADGNGSVDPDTEDVAPATGEANGSTAYAEPGYRFVNWTNAAGDIVGTFSYLEPPTDANGLNVAATYTAHFVEADDVTINYEASTGGSVNPTFEELAPATGTAQGSIATADAGYRFVNWTDGSGQVSTDATFIPEKSGGLNIAATYTANFAPDIYTVSFDAQGGSTPSPESIQATFGSAYGTLPTPSRINYEFIGWYTASVGGIEITSGTTVEITENTILYARWDTNLIFQVTVGSGDSFSIPTSGRSATGGNAAYAWDIDWGDNTTTINATGTSSAGAASTGITHNYTSAGTYNITIRPHDTTSPFQWARAFGFSWSSNQSSATANKAKVTSAIAMPTKGFLQSATSTGNNFLYYTWYGCTSLTTAAVPETSNWTVTTIGDYFLSNTWSDCAKLTTAVVPDTSNWPVAAIGTSFLPATWSGCTSLTTAAVPDTSNWPVAAIGTYFLSSTWSDCAKLTTAAVPDTSNWPVTAIGTSFLHYTWSNCSSLKDLSNIKFSDSFKSVSNLYGGLNNWYHTFYLASNPGGTTGAQPSFYDGDLITDLGTPSSDRNTFTNRSGMAGYDDLADNWK
jgi:uncharacterized repeat protein (TIGR02543 family)